MACVSFLACAATGTLQPCVSMASPSVSRRVQLQAASVPAVLRGNRAWCSSRRRTTVRSFSAAEESLEPGSVIVVQDSDTMEKYIRDAGDKLVVVDVSTTTCGPCKLIYPKFARMSNDYPEAIFLKINGDENNDTRALMRKWGVKAVPNFRFYRNGELQESFVGANEDELLARFLTLYGQPSVV